MAFLLGRLLIVPLGQLEPHLTSLHGRVLSVGCGYGILDRYLVELNKDVVVEGFDFDEDRIAIARATEHRSPRFRAFVGDASRPHPGTDGYDAVSCIDLLHHIPFEKHADVVRSLKDRLRVGGRFIVKDIARTPTVKYRWNQLHDRLVVGSEPIYCREPDEMAAVLREAGLHVDHVGRLGRFSPYPHYLVIARG